MSVQESDRHQGSSGSAMDPPAFEEDKMVLNVDLIEAARHQLDFLQEVDRHPCLYEGPLVKNAIRRYETCWLQLLSNNRTANIAPPLDVHWVWHCHMLAPYYYEKDCMKIVGMVPSHSTMSYSERSAANKVARQLWNAAFPDEVFNLDLDSPNTWPETVQMPYQSQCKYNIEAAIARQRLFFYQVSLPHYRDECFLKRAVQRYKKYLFLKKNHLDMFLVPCYDFDLVWHSHQLHPQIYKEDTSNVLGHMFNHDDSVNDRAEDSKLNRSDAKTRELWKKFFTEEFALCGAMFRGEPPSGKLQQLKHHELATIFSKSAEVVINSLKVENINEEQKFTLRILLKDREGIQVSGGPVLLKLKSPQKEWANNGKGITKFTFDTATHALLQFNLSDKKGFLCFGSNHSFGLHNLPFSSVVENTPQHGQTINQTLPLLEGGSGPPTGHTITLSATVEPPSKGPCILSLQAGPFQTYTMPENIEQLWGPIPLPRLPEGVPNTCIVASHR